ncbi:metallophosphoesterase [Oscillatoria sp. FACHB-1406]|uniref:metallophosphoesterase n=1 Tax=Oscillatoria sp. FACHB-1406 TaxID=2692846 RepID=UPI001681CE38|nr:phosphodiesterase [Oscillatoria sp. FACHB-1406]
MLHIAQITDTHLFCDRAQTLWDLQTAASFQAVIQRLQQLEPQPDILLLTGDLSQDMTPESYQHLCDELKFLDIPIYALPGNHDDLDTMAKVLKKSSISLQNEFTVSNWQFLLLNSTIPDREEGYLSAETLTWLEQKLQQNRDRFIIIALHHPPIAVTPKWEKSMLQNADDLFAILDCAPQVKLVLFGHIHQAFEREREEILYLGTPSTCQQFDENDELAPKQQPGLRLIDLTSDGTLKTRVERIAYFS